MRRRDLLENAATLAGWAVAGSVIAKAPALLAQPAQGESRPFSWEGLKDHARELAGGPYAPPSEALPPQVAALSWDEYNAIKFKADHALWAGAGLPFQVQFFHLGIFFKSAVRIDEVTDGRATPIPYDPAMFDYGPNHFDPPLPADLGFAGFRLNFHENFAQDVVVFQGASYFRATDWQSHYGMSCRGLAIDTGMEGRPEEFPIFRQFWLVRPTPTSTTLTVFALLDSLSTSGAYRFEIAPGGTTIMDVTCHLYPRQPVERLGIAPLTSMFQYGENDRRVADDWRPEIHDSDGLSMRTGADEWIWRPLVNPARIRVSSFLDDNPRGFGLLQRDRDFNDYQDEGARYERRPSVWVTPKGDWGKGQVMLVELPAPDETMDNIVAFWKPAAPFGPGHDVELAYRLYWCERPPDRPVSLAQCVATRIGKGGIIGHAPDRNLQKFVVDFSGGDLPLIHKDEPVEPVITLSRGTVERLTALDGKILISPLARPLPEINGWRVNFDISWQGTEPIELRMFLKLGPSTLTETWIYQWDPPHP